MKPSTEKFLKFNDRTISFLAIDGQYWIAIKPICEALNINYSRQLRTIKSDELLSQLWSLETMVGGDNKVREMAAIPEKYVYGWLFSIKSDSAELLEYKRECYELLYNYFHGAITGRSEVLKEKIDLQREQKTLLAALKDNPEYQRLMSIETAIMRTGKDLKSLDAELVKSQMEIWNS